MSRGLFLFWVDPGTSITLPQGSGITALGCCYLYILPIVFFIYPRMCEPTDFTQGF